MAMNQSVTSITTERRGYGRGLILGLTVAETFVLLVFCLLLVAAAAITAERERASEALAERDRVAAETARIAQEAEELRKGIEELRKREQLLAETNARLSQTLAALPREIVQSTKIDEDWRELKLARELKEAASENGLSPAEAMALLPAMKVLKDERFLEIQPGSVAEALADLLSRAQEAGKAKPHEWPPIINLSEAGGYYFAVGSAELSPEFRRELGDGIAGQIAAYLKAYEVDVVEVIGHTDEQPLAGLSSNFDQTVQPVMAGDIPITTIHPADNAGLGLARAIAVAGVLHADPRLAGATILPLSGGQLIMPGDLLTDGEQAGDVETRRRIEIRVRRRSDQVTGG